MNPRTPTAMRAAVILTFVLGVAAMAAGRPNIVFVITDDQGYGDLGCTGNAVIETPHIDALASESSQLDDYHVAPTCSPTRAALLTGHWTNRTGVWHTVNGRSMLRADEVTLAAMLGDAGYATGMFGKWHLGDSFPYRPEDRGFDEVYRHGGGGVGQTPDVWDNAYFDGSYFHNGAIVSAEGFCTDVFFDEARRFIREHAGGERPFFAYISTNAPHGPFHCPQRYLDRYADQPPDVAAFFGMITNIDDNVGETRALLDELGIADDTVFVFTTDNGTAGGAKVFNAGMRGQKGSQYEGGHRVPFFLHWPGGGMAQKHVSGVLTHAVDVVPTLLDLCGVPAPEGVRFDGISAAGFLDPAAPDVAVPERFVVTDSQRVRDPIKWRMSAVMSERWRLIDGKELYDIEADPGQRDDVAADHPGQVAEMRAFYEGWWAELEPTFAQTTAIVLGHPDHREVTLTGHDWIQEALPPWSQAHVRSAHMHRPGGRGADQPAEHLGHWAVEVSEPGRFTFELRRWPPEADHPVAAALPPGDDVPGASDAYRARPGVAIPVAEAVLRIDGEDVGTKPVAEGDRAVTFEAELAAGPHQLAPVFRFDGGEVGAYYVTVRKDD